MDPVLAGLFVFVPVLGIVGMPALSDRLATRRYPIIVCGVTGTAETIGLLVDTSVWSLSASSR